MAKRAYKSGGQNMTEGYVSKEMRGLHLIRGQESDPEKIRKGLPKNFRVYIPDQDHKQFIAWDTDVFRGISKGGYEKFHGSGQGDPHVSNSIQTPRRGLVYKPLLHIPSHKRVLAEGSWIMNSWEDPTPDATTAERRRLAKHSFDVIDDFNTDKEWEEFFKDLELDYNSVHSQGEFEELKIIQRSGLDRHAVSKRMKAKMTGHMPVVGVGPDLKHPGLRSVVILP